MDHLREQIVAEIMKLVRPETAEVSPRSIPMTPRSIDELEKVITGGGRATIDPDGNVSVQPPPCTVGDVADAVLRVVQSQRRSGDSSLHAVRSERKGLRLAQSKAVMPLIGPLLDAWEGLPNDAKEILRESEPVLCAHLDKINAAMDGALHAPDQP